MSHRDSEVLPLGESARRLVDAARPHEGLSAERKARLRGRVMAAVAAGAGASLAAGAAKAAEVGAGSASATSGVTAGALEGAGGIAKVAGISLFAKIGVGVSVVAIGAVSLLWSRAYEPRGQGTTSGGTSAAVVFDDDDTTPATAATSDDAASTVAAPADSEAPSTTGFPSASAIAGDPRNDGPEPGRTEPASAVPSGSPQASASASADPADTLQEEMKLLAAAHAALSQGNANGALVLLDQHAARFPRGTMAPERRATRAMALCKAGRTDEGLREMNALYGADSKSPMAQKLARACGR